MSSAAGTSALPTGTLEQQAINTIRTLSMDAVQAANSGHPGTPIGMAPVVYTLWQQVLQYDPQHPDWPNRDRFVLSCGHASMLLYSILHLAGVRQTLGGGRGDELAVPLDDIRRFRQLGTRTPGHPESHLTSGVETTTGPLGQGVANSVGMAIAARFLAARYNKPGHELFNHRVYALCGDGCLMEGISAEAASVAGHLQLGNLCWIYDSNRITIEGHTDLAFTEDIATRFAGHGWQVIQVADANDTVAVEQALRRFQSTTDRPTLIIVHSHIAWGCPNKQDTHAAHGEPLGDEEIKLAKRNYGWPEDARFLVPEGVVNHLQAGLGQRGSKAYAAWQQTFAAYRAAHPELARDLEQMARRELPANWAAEIRQAFDRYAAKMLHPPLASLRSESHSGPPHGLLEALKRLFNLTD